jgi:enoyl-CoA hydratase/carnithine racemase
LGGMLELLIHCHYLVALEDAEVGAPEVTLPVVPGMELCHFPFRKAKKEDWHKLTKLLLEGRNIKTKNTVGWIVDYAGNMSDTINMAWKLANEDELILPKRKVIETSLQGFSTDLNEVTHSENPVIISARLAILNNIRKSCGATIGEALEIQARNSAAFMISKECRQGFVGSDYFKTMEV